MIPSAVSTQLAALQVATAAAQPLEAAPASQVVALVTAGSTLLDTIDTALSAAGKPLDAGDPSGFPLAMIAGLQDLSVAAQDQSTLSDMRGYVGRAVLNLAQAGS